MPTFVLDLAIAIGVDNLDDLLENPVGIFESWPGISLFFSCPSASSTAACAGSAVRSLTVINLLQTALQCLPVQFILVLIVELLPERLYARIPLVL